MTKSEIVTEISKQTGIEKSEVLKTLEAFIETGNRISNICRNNKYCYF